MNAPETNDPIEKLLREQDSYIPDDGFSRQVLSRVPNRSRAWTRVVYLAVLAVLAVLAGFWLPWGSLPELNYQQVIMLDPKVISAWLPVVAVLVALGSGILAALRGD